MTTTTPPKASQRPDGERSLAADVVRLGILWPYLRQDKRLVFIAMAFIPAISALETVQPLVLKNAIDKGILANDQFALGRGALYFGLAVLGSYLTRAGQSVATSKAVLRMIRTLRKKLVLHVMELKASFHDRSLSGALVTRATGDFDNLSDSLNNGVLTSIVDLAVLIGCIAGMLLLNWRLALIALLLLPLVFGVVQYFSKALKGAMLRARVKIASLNAFTQECLYGHQTVKLLNAEAEATKRFEVLNIEFRDAQMSSVVLDALMFAVLDGIASVTVGLVLWLVVSRAGGKDAVSAGVMVAFVQFIQQLFEPLKQLGNKMAMLQGAFTSIDRVFGVLNESEKVAGGTAIEVVRGEVEFRHVTFSYGGASKERVLDDVSFHLDAGQSLALVGATGSGKSTVVKLLAKLYDGYSGQILLDGQDLALLDPSELRRRMSIVPQDIVLFDGTVAFNIGLGMDGVSRERIEHAAQQVGAEGFILKLPGGYEHEIREQGANLSHGQRQLIAFARALAKDPSLVILDEATSSVDPESEAVIQAAIETMLAGRSVVVIAHRLSTIRACSRILVVDKGRILEAGRHDELLAQRGPYYRLHEALEQPPNT